MSKSLRGRAASPVARRKRAAQELATWMKLLLKVRGMSVSELARRAKRDRADVSRSLDGTRVWEFDRIKDYAAALLLEPRDIVDIPSKPTHQDAFRTVFRPITDWAMVRSWDRGLAVPPF